MSLKCLRRNVLFIIVALPLAGCLETVGRPSYNPGPTTTQTCGLGPTDGGCADKH